MAQQPGAVEGVDNEAEGRFEARTSAGVAELTYDRREGKLFLCTRACRRRRRAHPRRREQQAAEKPIEVTDGDAKVGDHHGAERRGIARAGAGSSIGPKLRSPRGPTGHPYPSRSSERPRTRCPDPFRAPRTPAVTPTLVSALPVNKPGPGPTSKRSQDEAAPGEPERVGHSFVRLDNPMQCLAYFGYPQRRVWWGLVKAAPPTG
jgi:hypothetical protein